MTTRAQEPAAWPMPTNQPQPYGTPFPYSSSRGRRVTPILDPDADSGATNGRPNGAIKTWGAGNRLKTTEGLTFAEYVGRTRAWSVDALCAQAVEIGEAYPDMWFPKSSADRAGAAAATYCHDCPVRARCEQYADETGATVGIWGSVRLTTKGSSTHQHVQVGV